jgi:CheY-like chemotaxis protein
MPSLLIVCPVPEHHEFVERALQSTSWTLRHATSCRTAAETLAAGVPTAILCEHNLPDGTWHDILSLTQRYSPPIALIVSSPKADHGLWAEVLNVGGYDVVAQPFDEAELRRILAAAARAPTSVLSHTA